MSCTSPSRSSGDSESSRVPAGQRRRRCWSRGSQLVREHAQEHLAQTLTLARRGDVTDDHDLTDLSVASATPVWRTRADLQPAVGQAKHLQLGLSRARHRRPGPRSSGPNSSDRSSSGRRRMRTAASFWERTRPDGSVTTTPASTAPSPRPARRPQRVRRGGGGCCIRRARTRLHKMRPLSRGCRSTPRFLRCTSQSLRSRPSAMLRDGWKPPPSDAVAAVAPSSEHLCLYHHHRRCRRG